MFKILLVQIVLTLILGFSCFVFLGSVWGYSALLGGFGCVIPNVFLALRLVLTDTKLGAQSLLKAAFIGELGKIALTVGFFLIVFIWVKPLEALALFGAFIFVQLSIFTGFLIRE